MELELASNKKCLVSRLLPPPRLCAYLPYQFHFFLCLFRDKVSQGNINDWLWVLNYNFCLFLPDLTNSTVNEETQQASSLEPILKMCGIFACHRSVNALTRAILVQGTCEQNVSVNSTGSHPDVQKFKPTALRMAKACDYILRSPSPHY